MRRLILFIRALFCKRSNSPETATVPRGTQHRGGVPKSVESNSDDTASNDDHVKGTTKEDEQLLNDMLEFLEKMMQGETLSPRKRESIQICREFMKEHGYPAEDYSIYVWSTHGIVKVLHDDETNTLPHTAEHAQDSFCLGAPEYDLPSFRVDVDVDELGEPSMT